MSSTVVPDAAADGNANLAKTPAQLMREQHEAAATHHVTVEDTVDEDDIQHPPPSVPTEKPEEAAPAATNGTMSAKAAGKQKASEKLGAFNTQDDEAFPALGPAPRAPPAPRTGGWANAAAAKAPGVSAATSRPSSGMPTPSSTPGIRTPTGAGAGSRPAVSLPGRATDQFEIENTELDKSKNLRKILDDVFRKFNVKVTTKTTGLGKKTAFVADGPKTKVTDALMHISQSLTVEKVSTLEIPSTVTAQIIGKGGANIKKLESKFGVKIHTDRSNRKTSGADDAGTDIVEIKGHSAQVAQVYDEIANQARQLQPKVDVPVRGIPPEFYPFIAGRHAEKIRNLEAQQGLNINIPAYHTWQSQAPAKVEKDNGPARFHPHGDSHITISGDQAAAKSAGQQFERLAEQLQTELFLEELQAQQFMRPFIVGDRGIDPLEFLEKTGCVVVLPPGHHETEEVHIIGPQSRLDEGRNLAEELMAQKAAQQVNLHKQFSDAPLGPERHSRALAQYLQRRAIEREFNTAHNAELIFPSSVSAAPEWIVIGDDPRKAMSARNELSKITQAFPTPRLQLVEIDPFFHPHLEQLHAQKLQNDLGVYLIVPDDGEESVVLVYEGPHSESPFQIPRTKPSKQELSEFEKALKAAEELLRSSIPHQGIENDNVEVPRKFHDKVRRYVNQEQVQSPGAFPVQIDFGGRRQQAARGSPNFVELRHPERAAVDELKRKIQQFLVEAEQDEKERGYVTTLQFPAKYNKNLIGRNGAHVNQLREKHDVDIQVSREGGDEIKIQGPQKKAEACKAEIQKLLKAWENEVNYVIKIDSKFHGQLVGRSGENLRKILAQSDNEVRIDFPRASRGGVEDSSDIVSEAGARVTQPSDEIRIRGPKAKADAAREQLLALKQYYEDNSHTATVSVAQDQVGSLIGRGGQELEKLRADTNAQIDIPKSNGAKRIEITIRGSKDAVKQAKSEIEKRSKAYDAVVTKTIDVDSKHRNAIIGAGGSNIRDIVKKAGGSENSADHVKFPARGEDSNTITIKGTQDVVDKIITSIKGLVSEKENQVNDSVDVPVKLHRNLIGAQGANRKEFEAKFGVSMNVPRQNSGETAVKLAGPPENVQKAKDHLLAMTDAQKGETVTVPRKFHHAVAQNGATFGEFTRMGVRIDHAGQKPPSRPKAGASKSNGDLPLITDQAGGKMAHSWEVVPLTSDEDGEIAWNIVTTRDAKEGAVDKAKARILELLEQAEEPRFTGYLTLPDPALHKRIIGSGGKTINGMRNATACDIQVPRPNDKTDAITITGSEDGVLKAKDMILEVIEGGNGN
ncbi:uncharacterized protein HMPREF1541_06068 [Cyphellophora europaea CBS 101466]|uniref:K Homology domain-containing protein n=1 Tax=Cyphellophora europaea (strain CBS 101466) TaxID=1220924 RepID=W2RTS3_CYPE1|nr:uncharacterized protein HMPREF1541_06068 [Cyphellophora europaea CBS 101466]ETN39842.1 hypothetical protein HMPREF1541_06068 [Cyphellophora europaea CBS 101466]